jgi:hypothetical protein
MCNIEQLLVSNFAQLVSPAYSPAASQSPRRRLPARIFISVLFIGVVGEGRLCGSQWAAQSSRPGRLQVSLLLGLTCCRPPLGRHSAQAALNLMQLPPYPRQSEGACPNPKLCGSRSASRIPSRVALAIAVGHGPAVRSQPFRNILASYSAAGQPLFVQRVPFLVRGFASHGLLTYPIGERQRGLLPTRPGAHV